MQVCPHCQSHCTRKLSNIWEEGISIYQESGRIRGIGRFTSRGETMTVLAKKVAPPQKQSWRGWLRKVIRIIVTATIISTLVAMKLDNQEITNLTFWLLVGLGISYVSVAHLVQNYKTYPTLRAKWLLSYRCDECERIFLGRII